MKNTILIVLLILLGTITSCNKWQKQYPEDTERTKLTPEERIANKWWNLDSVYINGTNITNDIFDSISFYKMYFDTKRVTTQGSPNGHTIGNNSFDKIPYSQRFFWGLLTNQDSIQISLDGYPYLNLQIPSYCSGSSNWGVLKLSQVEMKLVRKYQYSINNLSKDSIVTNYFSIH